MLDKRLLRQEILFKRSEYKIKKEHTYKDALFIFEEIKSVAFFYPIKNEPDISHLWEYAWGKGIITLLPRVITSTKMIFCPFDKTTILMKNKFGILEPQTELFLGQIDVVFVPGLAFDKNGTRLGYGGGFYDRYLSESKNIKKIGVCYKNEIFEHLPSEEHDIFMDAILTDESYIVINSQ